MQMLQTEIMTPEQNCYYRASVGPSKMKANRKSYLMRIVVNNYMQDNTEFAKRYFRESVRINQGVRVHQKCIQKMNEKSNYCFRQTFIGRFCSQVPASLSFLSTTCHSTPTHVKTSCIKLLEIRHTLLLLLLVSARPTSCSAGCNNAQPELLQAAGINGVPLASMKYCHWPAK